MTTESPSVADVAAATLDEHRRRRARQVRLAVVFIGCVLLFDAVFGEQGLFRTIKSRQDLLRAGQEISDLKRRNVALKSEVHRLQQDPATLELIAREEFGLIRPGEILVVLADVK